MTALSADRVQVSRGTEAEPLTLAVGVAASTTIYGGSLVAVNAAGYAVPASDDKALQVVGVAVDKAVGTTNGAVSVAIKQGVFRFANSASADAITLADKGAAVFAVDDQTVAKTATADNSRPVAGIVEDVTTDGVFLRVGSLDRCAPRGYAVTTITDDGLTEDSTQTEEVADLGYLPAGSMVFAHISVTEAFAASAGAGLIQIGDGSTADLIASVDAETIGETSIGPVYVNAGGDLTITFDAGSGEVPADFSAGAATVTVAAIQA